MIRASKRGVKYASIYKVSNQILNDLGEDKAIKILKSDPVRFKIPKNTLRINYLGHQIGLNGDDFVMDSKTILFNYMVYTFKR